LLREVEGVATEAGEKLHKELHGDYEKVNNDTGAVGQTRTGLKQGLDALHHEVQHLESQVPEEQLPKLDKIKKVLKGHEANNEDETEPSPTQPASGEDKDGDKGEDKGETKGEDNGEDNLNKAVLTSVPNDDGRHWHGRSPVEDFNGTACPPPQVLSGYRLVQRGFWSPQHVLPQKFTMKQCAERCTKMQKECSHFSFQRTGQCSLSGAMAKKARTDLCIYGFEKVHAHKEEAETNPSMTASAEDNGDNGDNGEKNKGNKDETSESPTADEDKDEKNVNEEPPWKITSPTAVAKTPPAKTSKTPKSPKSPKSSKASKAKTPKAASQSAYCSRPAERSNTHAENVRHQLCQLLAELASLRKTGGPAGGDAPVAEEEPAPTVGGQEVIPEPTLGTDQVQEEAVAKAQAAAWRKRDEAQILPDPDQGITGTPPGPGVLKLKNPRLWPHSQEADSAGYRVVSRVPHRRVPSPARPARKSGGAVGEVDERPPKAAEKALEEAAAEAKKMASTADKNRMVADLDTPDTTELRKLLSEVGHRLKEVEDDPDFSKHQAAWRMVHHYGCSAAP